MRVSIIGAGNIAQYAHLPGYQKVPGVQIVAICDIVPERAKQVAARWNVPQVFTDYHEMLKLPLDAVSICVPNCVHAEATIAALESGAHVLCEKPMALDALEGEAMVAAAKRTGKYLMMGYNNRFRADTQALKKLIDGGRLGEIYFARCGWIRRRGIPAPGSWFTRKSMSGGGALIDIGVHALDLTMWLMGMPKPAVVMGATYARFGADPDRGAGGWGEAGAGGTFDVDDLACAMIRFANGATLSLEASWASHIERDQLYLHLMGTQAGARIDGSPVQTRIFTDTAGVVEDTTLVVPDAQPGGSHFAEIARFVACIQDKCEPECKGEDGVASMRILDAIYKSAQTGSSVAVA